MANGADTEEYVVLSRVRPGLKREFAFALKSHGEYAGSIGRTRSRRSQNGAVGNGVSENSSNKRLKSSGSKIAERNEEKQFVEEQITTDTGKSMERETPIGLGDDSERMSLVSEEEAKNDVVESNSDDDQKRVLVESVGKEAETRGDVLEPLQIELPNVEDKGKEPLKSSAAEDVKNEEGSESDGKPKLEMKMSKKIELKRSPTKLKDLLETGVLEGLRVRYLRGSKTRGQWDTGLRGIIKGSGILCSCEMCNESQVVTPNQFELHAGSSNKHPPEYIYLENGNTLRDVLNAFKGAPLELMKATIQNVIGCSSENGPTFCLTCKGSISEAVTGRAMVQCSSCMILEESRTSPAPMSENSDRSPTTISIPKSSNSTSFSSTSVSKTQGRLTRKDLGLHKLVFQTDALPDGTALAYYARRQKFLEGYKKGFGIFCFCCNSEVSPSQFEAHAGWASSRQPYLHIFTSNGVSLHELSLQLAKERKLSADENDDLCSICADGGDLLCCDNCPRAFHKECVALPSIPIGTWYCRYCQNLFQREKFVERNANAVAAGRIAGTDPIGQITNRCIRIVETAEADVDVCALCRGHDFSRSGFGSRTVIFCDQCEKGYHVGCLKEHKMDDLKELPKGKWFCCMDCNKIHSALQKLVVGGEEKLPAPLLNVIKKKQLEEKDSESSADLDIRWRLLSGKMDSVETKALLAKAVAIFHDRFDPISNSDTGHVDLIPSMVYGRNVRDQEFGGMYCAILSVNSTIVSAGIIRIFGKEVAELPLVATSSDYQGQGYFPALFSCIENLLGSLNVRNLVLPAADEAESIWRNRFGFKKITEDELIKYRKDYQMMIFQGTSMLLKARQCFTS